ncbi:MAG: hypothetical protein KDD02_23255 [Phaeodactylibacter sp.]|nr:hypothetical protein [Phaeodactylibacter sp.]
MARTETGHRKVQGIDYAYTLQGWIKGLNSSALAESRDMGKDGTATSLSSQGTARDAYGYTIGYFDGGLVLNDFNPYGTDVQYVLTNIDSVSLADNYIFIHSGWTSYPGRDRSAWLVINLEDDSKILLTGQGWLKPWLDSARIGKIRIYNSEKILKYFQENLKLPPEWPG